MATVINKKKSTTGGPYAFYTLTLTASNRTSSSVKISYTLKTHLQYAESYHGWALNAKITVGSSSTTVAVKGTETWSGTTVHSKSGSFTVSGLSASTTSLSNSLTVTSPSSGAGATLTKTSGTALSISAYSTPTASVIPAPDLLDTSGIAITYIFINGAWEVAAQILQE